MRSNLLRGGAIALAALFCLTNAASADAGGEHDPPPAALGGRVIGVPPVLYLSFCQNDPELVQDATLGAACSDYVVLPDGNAPVPATASVCSSLNDLLGAHVDLDRSGSAHVALPGVVSTFGEGCAAPEYFLGRFFEHTNYNRNAANQNIKGWYFDAKANYKCSDWPQGRPFHGVADLRGTRYDNEISSAQANPGIGCSVKLFQHPQYRGSAALCAPFCRDLHGYPILDPPGRNMNDRTSAYWFEYQRYDP